MMPQVCAQVEAPTMWAKMVPQPLSIVVRLFEIVSNTGINNIVERFTLGICLVNMRPTFDIVG